MAAQIVVHGHFYQPPRENPWTGTIDDQPDAAPFPNWNELVHSQCYRANAFATIQTNGETHTVNNFERISFDVGPTLLAWLETEQPKTYKRILAADRTSLSKLGHGNAIAQAYHHTILPLSPTRDVRTEIRWGLADFERRFGRASEGMWLPEAAANDEVLGALIDCGVQFTILAPWQAGNWRAPDGPWVDARSQPPDAGIPYRYLHPDGSGRELIVFFYDADIARRIAFEDALSSADAFLASFAERPGPIVNAATDGETYGHHFKFGDMGLAFALFVEAERSSLRITNYAAALEGTPAVNEVVLRQGKGTSWSCLHGVGRWERDCGCWTGGQPDWDQRWRAPLRAALEVVRDAADDSFGRLGRLLFADPWGARDRYIEVLTRQIDIETFARREAGRALDSDEMRTTETLLELQRMAMAMFTSCGWFFNDISGIETVQILRYAARALELLEGLGQQVPLEVFLRILSGARSNILEQGTGADIFLSIGRPVGYADAGGGQ